LQGIRLLDLGCGLGLTGTVEEGCLSGGYGSAVLETASDAGWDVRRLRRLGLPDRFVEHGERRALLANVGLDADGIAQACLAMARNADMLCRR